MPYNHVEDTVQDFLSWVRELDSIDSVIEIEDRINSESAFTATAEQVNDSFPAVKAKINFVHRHSTRTFYFTKTIEGLFTFTHGEWERKTFMDFDIVPIHNFTDGAYYYFIQLLGGSDVYEQYDYILSYEVYFKSGNNIVGSVLKSSPDGTVIGDVANDLTAATFSIDGRLFFGGIASKKVKSEDKAGVPLKMKNCFTWKGVDGNPKIEDFYRDCKKNHKIINECSAQKAGWQWEFSRPEDGSQGTFGVWLVDRQYRTQ